MARQLRRLAEHGAVLDLAAGADPRPGVDHDVGAEARARADHCARVDDRVRADLDARADLGAGAEDREQPGFASGAICADSSIMGAQATGGARREAG